LKQYIKTHPPRLSVEKDGVIHKLWGLSDKKIIAHLKLLFRDIPIFIADGHHRYQAALTYFRQQKNKGRFKPAFGRVMTYLAPCQDMTLTIFPTHRVVKKMNIKRRSKIFDRLNPLFRIRRYGGLQKLFAAMERKKNCFGMYLGGGRFYLLKLKETVALQKLLEASPREYRTLDVSLLHNLVLTPLVECRKHGEETITYTRHKEEAVQLVDSGSHQAVFFLNPTRASEVKKIAEAQLVMPHKSTYFYPKPLTGLVINKF
jgi:uncharacterized protein (DUF1015 family)